MKNVFSKDCRPYLVILLMPLAFVIACGSDDSGPVDPDEVTFVKAGWRRYAEGDFASAKDKFEDAISANRNLGDGYNGVGWVLLATWVPATGGESITLESEPGLAEALGYFDRAVAEGFVDADAHAGRCIILNAVNEYRQAVYAGAMAVEIDTTFQLPGDENIDVRDIRLAMAQSYYELGDYEEALEQAVLINPNLDPINANSETFLVQLRSRLEQLYWDLF